MLPAGIWAELSNVYRDFLRRKLREASALGPRLVSLNGKSFDVKLSFGVGDEGEALLVKSKDGYYVLKKFTQLKDMQKNLELVKKFRADGLNILEPIDFNWNDKIALFPFAPGLNMGQILRGKDLLISPETRQILEKKYSQFKSDLNFPAINPGGRDIYSRNVVLNLNSKEFVFVDSR